MARDRAPARHGRRHLPVARGLAPPALQRGVPARGRASHGALPAAVAAGAALLPRRADGRPHGARDQRRRCRGDGRGGSVPRRVRRHAHARARGRHDDARHRLAPGPGRAPAVSAHGDRVLRDLPPRARGMEAIARPLLRPQRARAGVDRRGPHLAGARPHRACRGGVREADGRRRQRELPDDEVGVRVRARGGPHAQCGDRADAGARRMARLAGRAHGRRADRVHDVPRAAHLAHVRCGMGALADRARQGGVGPARARAARAAVDRGSRNARCAARGDATVRERDVRPRRCCRPCRPRRLVRPCARPHARHRGSDGCRKVDAPAPAASSRCPAIGLHSSRRRARRGVQARRAVRPPCLGAAGAVPVLGDDCREHRARAPGGFPRAGRACGAHGGPRWRRDEVRRGIRHARRRARRHLVRRAAPARGDRARALVGCAAAPARRCVVRRRHRDRVAHPRALARRAVEPQRHHREPSPVGRRRCGRDRRAARRRDRRAGQSRRVDRPRRLVRRAVAVSADRGILESAA